MRQVVSADPGTHDPESRTVRAGMWLSWVAARPRLMACLELPAGLRVLLLSKDSEPRSASRWAQGGIAAVTRADDSFDSHSEDTLRAGRASVIRRR